MSHKEIIAKQSEAINDLLGSHHADPEFDATDFDRVEAVPRGKEAKPPENFKSSSDYSGVTSAEHTGELSIARRTVAEAVRRRGGSSVYLDQTANQNAQETLRRVPQPRHKIVKGDHVVEWEITRFVWWSHFLGKLPVAYLTLLNLLDIEEEDYYAEYQGFYNYRHSVQNSGCPVESIFVPVVNCGRYHPYASVKHRRRASVRAYDRLEFLEEECRKRRVKFDYIVTIDLTLPKEISERWNEGGVDLNIRNAVQDFLTELHNELFPHKSSQFGVTYNPHYWATRTPLEPHRHLHFNIPNVAYNKRTDMFHRFKPYLDADLVRKIWKRVLEDNDLWHEGENKKPVIFVGYIKFANKEKVLHRLSYCCRKPVEDLVLNLNVNDLNEFDVGFAQFLLDYTPRRINLGFLTNLKRFGYSRKSTPFRCPICGCEMEPELGKVGDKRLYPRPPPEILHMFQDRTGDWRETVNLVTR